MPDEAEIERGHGEPTADVHLRSTFEQSVDEGIVRTRRSWPDLLATGLVGGMDVTIGVLALLVVQHETGSLILGALAFSIGFLALTLGRSELFTENFLVPIAAFVAGKATVSSVLRLWIGTLVMNLVGGWMVSWLIVWGLPHLHGSAVELGAHYAGLDTGQLAALGVIGGALITLMTWMVHGANDFGRIMAVVSVAFLLAAGHLNHVIVASIEMFVGLHTGDATYGYGEIARVAGIATVTNMVGGLLLVTAMRLIQVGGHEIEEERHRPDPHPEERPD